MTEFFDKILNSAENLKNLTIQTIVGDFSLQGGKVNFNPQSEKTDAIYTQIDLLDGDITTAMSAKFLEESYKEVREFHKQREQAGQEIIRSNIETLKQIAAALIEILKMKPDSTTTEPVVKPGGKD